MVVQHEVNPTFRKHQGIWYCQSMYGHYLMTGLGYTKEDAEREWKDEIKKLEKELKQSQP